MITKGKGPAQASKSLVYGAICGMGLAFALIYLIWRLNGGAAADLVIRPGIFLLMSSAVALGYWLSDTLIRLRWKEEVLELVDKSITFDKIAEDKLVELAKKVEAQHILFNKILCCKSVEELAQILNYREGPSTDLGEQSLWWHKEKERAERRYDDAVNEFFSCYDDFRKLSKIFDFKLRERNWGTYSGTVRS